MKNNIREKMISILLLFGGVVIMLTITGFTSSFSIIKSNESRHMETVSRSPVTPPTPSFVVDTIPEIDWDEIKEEMEEARIEAKRAMEEIDWDEIKKEMEEAKLEAKKAMEEIDWDEIKKEMSGVKLHLDSVLQDMDFDFDDLDVDIDFDFDDLDVDMDFDFDDLDVDMDFDFDNLEMAMDSIPS